MMIALKRRSVLSSGAPSFSEFSVAVFILFLITTALFI